MLSLLDLITSHNLINETLELKRNEYLCRPGLINTNIYLIESGSLRIYITDEGEEHVVRFGYPDSIITALDSYISGKPSQFFIQAIKSTVVHVIEKEAFEELMMSDVEMMMFWQHIMADLIQGQLEREVDLLTASPAERYRRVLERSPQLFQEIPNKYIASYLRMSPETLSRLKKS